MASANFINECKNYANCNRYGRLTIQGTGVELNQSNVIQEFTIDDGCYVNGNIIGSVYGKKLNAQLINALDKTLEDASFLAQVGLTYVEEVGGVEQETTEYIDLGKFTIEKPKDEQTDNYTSFVAYDDLANNIDKVYVCGINYTTPKTLSDLYVDVCVNLGLTPRTTTFLNSDIPIANNPFTNKETNRTVLQIICKIACSFVDIDYSNNKIDLVWLSNSLNYTFQMSDYSTLDGGKIVYGPVNTLVIRSTSVESENVSQSDAQSIAQYGEHQIVIDDDYILNTSQLRQQALTGIWNRVHNLEYVDCELTTLIGKPFLKVGNKIRIYTDDNDYFDTYVLQHQFIFDGAFTSVIKSPAMTEQEVTIKQDISLKEKLSETTINVNKQEKKIEQIVSSVGANGEVTAASIITAINNDTSQVDIQADKINLNGAVTANNNFKINTDGTVEIKNGNIEIVNDGTTTTNRILVRNQDLSNFTSILNQNMTCGKMVGEETTEYSSLSYNNGLYIYRLGENNEPHFLRFSPWYGLTISQNNTLNASINPTGEAMFNGDVTINGQLDVKGYIEEYPSNTTIKNSITTITRVGQMVMIISNGEVGVNSTLATGETLYLSNINEKFRPNNDIYLSSWNNKDYVGMHITPTGEIYLFNYSSAISTPTNFAIQGTYLIR